MAGLRLAIYGGNLGREGLVIAIITVRRGGTHTSVRAETNANVSAAHCGPVDIGDYCGHEEGMI